MSSIGATSIDLMRLKRKVEKQLSRAMIASLIHPTIRAQVKSIEIPNRPTEYSPIVKMQYHGVKSPLWLIHPGVEEILVFSNLAKHITDRSVYIRTAEF